uniref:Uncharacterized protein n=1 Tax=Eutreptiella gymnastica TaxID=73025 RepID=A0A7S4G142_9EUGL
MRTGSTSFRMDSTSLHTGSTSLRTEVLQENLPVVATCSLLSCTGSVAQSTGKQDVWCNDGQEDNLTTATHALTILTPPLPLSSHTELLHQLREPGFLRRGIPVIFFALVFPNFGSLPRSPAPHPSEYRPQ